jgi:hypothetical protein
MDAEANISKDEQERWMQKQRTHPRRNRSIKKKV